MRFRLIFCMIILAYAYNPSYGQKGEIFPYLEGTTLSGKELVLPEDTKGKFSLIGMAYSKKSEDDLKDRKSVV